MLLLAGLVLLGLLVAGAAGLGLLGATGRRPPSRVGLPGALVVVPVVAVGVVVVVAGLGLRGAGNGEPDGGRDERPAESASPDAPTRGVIGASPAALGLGPEVVLSAGDDPDERGAAFPDRPEVVDGLASPTVLPVRVSGFPSFAGAVAEQCVAGPAPRCGNRIPVQFDEDGRAHFQYLVTGAFVEDADGCGTDGPTCMLVVRGPSSADEVSVRTVFGGTLPPPAEERVPPTGLEEAQRPAADYDPPRLVAGLVVAGLLLLMATWLVARTDWSPVGEAAAPEIDEAEYADLDAIVAALPPEDEDPFLDVRA